MRKLTFFLACLITIFILNVGCTQEEDSIKEPKKANSRGGVVLTFDDDYVDEWNNSDDIRTLAQFLGLNEEEEDVWIDEGDDALYELLEQQKED